MIKLKNWDFVGGKHQKGGVSKLHKTLPPLTLAATAIFRAKHRVDRLPLAGSNGRVRGTSYVVSVTATAAAVGNKWFLLSATISVVIVTVLGSSWCNTELPKWRGKSRAFWLKLRKLLKNGYFMDRLTKRVGQWFLAVLESTCHDRARKPIVTDYFEHRLWAFLDFPGGQFSGGNYKLQNAFFSPGHNETKFVLSIKE